MIGPKEAKNKWDDWGQTNDRIARDVGSDSKGGSLRPIDDRGRGKWWDEWGKNEFIFCLLSGSNGRQDKYKGWLDNNVDGDGMTIKMKK
ncbi:hypothetical protein DERF_005053 [Dermatophagoides farinae]|uniref:Uncharacterized protein n=1 Tax=Dermatophagoides farinae TaxID=6954 RepID=A0A922I664_DERFA|nr:hypothetical protein DERF_005053 [Dermatophagoides farinae]